MGICYQIGILMGLIFIGLAIHIFINSQKDSYPSNLINFIFAISISTIGNFIIVASLAAIQSHNWYTTSSLWKLLVAN